VQIFLAEERKVCLNQTVFVESGMVWSERRLAELKSLAQGSERMDPKHIHIFSRFWRKQPMPMSRESGKGQGSASVWSGATVPAQLMSVLQESGCLTASL